MFDVNQANLKLSTYVDGGTPSKIVLFGLLTPDLCDQILKRAKLADEIVKVDESFRYSAFNFSSEHFVAMKRSPWEFSQFEESPSAFITDVVSVKISPFDIAFDVPVGPSGVTHRTQGAPRHVIESIKNGVPYFHY